MIVVSASGQIAPKPLTIMKRRVSQLASSMIAAAISSSRRSAP
jgi:hypothetical protein